VTLPTARSKPLRPSAVLAGSLAAHGLVLALLAFPRIEAFPDHSNDEDALTVTLERIDQTPEPRADMAAARAAPSQIQPRTPRAVFRASVAPLLVPGLAASPSRGAARHPAPLPEGPRGDLRAALRGSGVGCANGLAVGLNRREQERCQERWGEAARKAPVYAEAPIDPRKRAAFDQVAAGQAAYRRYLESPMAPGVDHRNRDGLGQAKDIPFVMGDTDGIGRKKSDQSLGIKP
jgi:hypothetical protein